MSRTVSIVAVCTLLFLAASESPRASDTPRAAPDTDEHAAHVASGADSPLAAHVRDVTAIYQDINQALAVGYTQFGGCVSGPEAGAMGVHFLKGSLVDGTLDPDQPEALIYEFKDGFARLLGVEYIAPVDVWNASHPNEMPVLMNQHFQLLGAPNRYRQGALYELQVWAWRHNPNGTFVDWNPRVSCDGAE